MNEISFLITGHFDVMNASDMKRLEVATLSGPLTVGVWSDALFEKMKGYKPNYPEEERLFMVRSVRWVADAHLIDTLPSVGSN